MTFRSRAPRLPVPLTLLLLVLPMCAAQAQSAEQFTLWGDNAEKLHDHYGASRFYAEALAQDPGKLELQWKYAEACRQSNQYPQAAEAYEKVQRKDLGHRFPEALRWLAEMQLSSGDYEGAQKTWQKVTMKVKSKDGFEARRAVNGMTSCAFAKRVMAQPEEVTIEHLPGPVNTYDSEFGARLQGDTLYFTSLRGAVNDDDEVQDTGTYHVAVYASRDSAGTWSRPRPLPPNVNGRDDNANSCWSPDHQWFYFTRCDAEGHCSLRVSYCHNGVMGDAEPIPGILEQGNTTQPMVVYQNGHNTLYYASDGPGGQGGWDIWSCSINGTHILNKRPLGTPVNTPGNETCPFFDTLQNKLYFSSDFLPGLGGYDNFMSEFKPEGFMPPVNFGYPLNSPANDLYPTFDATTMSGYFTSNRAGSLAKKGATCCNDIYRYSYPKPRSDSTLVVSVRNDTASVAALAQKRLTTLREKLPVRLYFHNDEPDPRSRDTLTALTYEQTYRSYKALVPDYHQAWKGNEQGTEAIDGFFREEVDHGFAQLNDFIALLEQAMREGQRIQLQVRGFASPLAKSDYNKNLSLRRIQSMVNYLRTVDGGAFVPYLEGTASNGGRLTIRKAPFGEDRSAHGVSDELKDLQGSVYSVGASRERRIEIEQVMLLTASADSVKAITGEDLVQDMGAIPQLKPHESVFHLRNTGSKPLSLMKARAECDCVNAELPTRPIPPGATADLIVRFNGRAPEGPLSRSITITTDGTPATFRVIVTADLTHPE